MDKTSTFVDGIQYNRVLCEGEGCCIITDDAIRACAFFDKEEDRCNEVNCFVDGKSYIFEEAV